MHIKIYYIVQVKPFNQNKNKDNEDNFKIFYLLIYNRFSRRCEHHQGLKKYLNQM